MGASQTLGGAAVLPSGVPRGNGVLELQLCLLAQPFPCPAPPSPALWSGVCWRQSCPGVTGGQYVAVMSEILAFGLEGRALEVAVASRHPELEIVDVGLELPPISCPHPRRVHMRGRAAGSLAVRDSGAVDGARADPALASASASVKGARP